MGNSVTLGLEADNHSIAPKPPAPVQAPFIKNGHSLAELYSIPAVPPALGEDGGKFWKYYDGVADELDDDLVKRLKSQLDGLLIFAGLFAGVNSGFLAMTLPLMSADPADDTNALLLQLVKGSDNTTQVDTNLPSSSFSPTPTIYAVNVLFAVSLTFALASSFLAVLGQQWLVHYRKRGGGGPDHERWEHLRRHLGAKRWKLELVLDDILPGLLQLGVAIFCVSFVIYLGTLNRTMWAFVAVPILVLLAGLLFMATAAAWDQWCPFQSPLSRAIYYCLPLAAGFARAVIVWGSGSLRVVARYFSQTFWRLLSIVGAWFGTRQLAQMSFSYSTPAFVEGAWAINTWLKENVRRPQDDPSILQFLALKRVICTSEDQRALDCAIANLRAVYDARVMRLIMADDEMHNRLRDLAFSSSPVYTSSSTNPMIERRALSYAGGFMHTVVLGGSLFDFLSSREQSLLSEDDKQVHFQVYNSLTSLWIKVIHRPPDNDNADKLIITSLHYTRAVLYLAHQSTPWPKFSETGGYDEIISFLQDDPSDKLIAVAACELMMINEWSQNEPNRNAEQIRDRLRTSFTNLQNAYTTGFTAATEYLQRAIETLPKDHLQSVLLSQLYVNALRAAFNWRAEHGLTLENDFLLQVASFTQGIWTTLDLQLKNDALLAKNGYLGVDPWAKLHFMRRESFSIAFRISHYIRYHLHARQAKLAAYQNLINSLVGHLRFVMEASTPEARHDNELLDFIRPFPDILHFPYFVDANGADQRAFTLLLRTVESFERWLLRCGTRTSSRRSIRDPEIQWCEWREDCRRLPQNQLGDRLAYLHLLH